MFIRLYFCPKKPYLCITENKKTMNNILQQTISEIKSLCHKHRVKSLYVFGSVLTPQFTDKSDVDFLVNFKKEEITDYFTNFFELKYALEQAIGREIDLVEERAIRNPIFKQSIERTKQLIYG